MSIKTSGIVSSFYVFNNVFFLDTHFLDRVEHVYTVLDNLCHGHAVAVEDASDITLLTRAV